MNKLLLTISVFFFIFQADSQNVVINEFMSKNNSTIKDNDGDYSDWIELYNNSNSSINLKDYSLSDDIDKPTKWLFPDLEILPHDFVLVFASGKDILDKSELHANFKISAGGEELFLHDNFGTLIDQTDAVDLSADQSYCRFPDGSEHWIISSNSTPKKSNNNTNELIFSHHQGFYKSPINLEITSTTDDTIYYTLNGDIPTDKSNIYNNALSITNRSLQPNKISEIVTSAPQDAISYKAWEAPKVLIDKATTIRCASFRNGVRTSDVYSKTYFIDKGIEGKYTLPIISIITTEENLFSQDSGLFVPGKNYNDNNPEWTGNYFMKGNDWERRVHIEYFDKDGNLGFSQNAGLRIQGGKTRQASQKSLRLYARKEYGKKYFDYKLLPNRNHKKYKRFVLRATMGAWGAQTIIQDEFAQSVSSQLNMDYQDFQPVIVYINGEYWGIHTIRDRIDERYIEYTHKIDKDSVEFFEWGNSDYQNLMNFIETNNLKYDENYNYVTARIDIDNYIDYNIAELFFANYDWPGNNSVWWRKKNTGKWRWVLFDMDGCFGNFKRNMFIHNTNIDDSVEWPNPPHSTLLFRSLIQNEKFKSRFINRYADVLNTYFTDEIMTHKLDSIKKLYGPEIDRHISRWNYPRNYPGWEEDTNNNILNFIENRSCAVKENIMKFFELKEFNFNCDPNTGKRKRYFIAPNPNNGNFTLLNSYPNLENATITITNTNGQLVYKESDVEIKRHQGKDFYLQYLSKGTYIIRITSEKHSEISKFIIIN